MAQRQMTLLTARQYLTLKRLLTTRSFPFRFEKQNWRYEGRLTIHFFDIAEQTARVRVNGRGYNACVDDYMPIGRYSKDHTLEAVLNQVMKQVMQYFNVEFTLVVYEDLGRAFRCSDIAKTYSYYETFSAEL